MNPPSSDRVTFCGRCGNEVVLGAKFCQSCGHELGEAVPATPDPPSPEVTPSPTPRRRGRAPAGDSPTPVVVSGSLEVTQKARRGCVGRALTILGLVGVVVIVVAVVAGIAGVGDSEGDDSPPTTTTPTTVTETPTTTISRGLGSQDATGDIVDMECEDPDSSGWAKVEVTVKNNSSETSNYSIEVVAESADGTEMFDWVILSMKYVAPGQMATDDSIFTDAGSGYVCRLREVQRLAAD